jgi:hypothetical protein
MYPSPYFIAPSPLRGTGLTKPEIISTCFVLNGKKKEQIKKIACSMPYLEEPKRFHSIYSLGSPNEANLKMPGE